MSNNNEKSKKICKDEDDGQIVFKSSLASKFASKHIKDMERLFDSKIGSDVIFDLPDSQIPAHKAILIARVPVFEKMFASGMIESQSNRVQIADSNRKSFDIFLRYVYCGKLPGNDRSLELWERLLLLASKYDVPDLVPPCAQRMTNKLARKMQDVDVLLAGATTMSQFWELHNFPTVKWECEVVLIQALGFAKLKTNLNRNAERFFSDYLLSLILFAHLHDCGKLHHSCISHLAKGGLRLEGEVVEKLKAHPDLLVKIIKGLVGEDNEAS